MEVVGVEVAFAGVATRYGSQHSINTAKFRRHLLAIDRELHHGSLESSEEPFKGDKVAEDLGTLGVADNTASTVRQ